MASNLYEYYQSVGQKLPSVSERQSVAQQAGITGYTGTKQQNDTLLGYLKSTPNQGGNNVITSDNLQGEKPVELKKSGVDTSATGVYATVGSMLESTKNGIAKDQADYDKKSAELAEIMKASGDTSAYEERVMKEQGVDTAKKIRDGFISQIEQEQKATLDRIEEVRKTFTGTTAGLNEEIGRIQRESANRLANYGIGLSASSRDYESASNIANRLIEANSNKIKADIESRIFVLEQLGTKLGTQQSQAFQLQLKQLEKEDSYLSDAVKYATDGATAGTIDGSTAFQAVSDLLSGKKSISQFYTDLGATGGGLGNINGYDITSYATDPAHELKVQSIYDTLPEITDEKTATTSIKSLSPNSPITGAMIMNASQQYRVDPKLMISIMHQDSALGTAGIGARNYNPGNIGQFDELGTTPTEGYKSWQEGVNAVASWLNKHRSTGLYRGEFQATLETAVNATGEPEVSKKRLLDQMKKYVANGDYKTLYKNLENITSKTLTGDVKTTFDEKRGAIPAIDDLRAKLQAYADAGGNTGLLKGTYEDIYSKLGTVADPKFKALATDLKISLQSYRQALSGAAFSEQESKDYASVNPQGKNKLDLNLAIIQGMRDNFKRQIDGTVDARMGDGAQYIREYAELGIKPNEQKVQPTYYSTPSGNSFQIIGE